MSLLDLTSIDLSKKFNLMPRNSERHDRKRLAFLTWLELGSLEKASLELAKKGVTGRNKHNLSIGGVRILAQDYIVEYPENARKIFQEKGEFPDTDDGDKEWLWYLVNVAAKHRNLRVKHKFLRWTLEKGIYKQAFKFFQSTFNLKDEDINAFD